MRLIYTTDALSTGQRPVMNAVADSDWFYFTHTIQVPISTIEIDELDPDNKALCIDLKGTQGRYDAQGRTKYHIVDGELHVNDDWQEAEPWL